MTVKELIEVLSKLNQDYEVVVDAITYDDSWATLEIESIESKDSDKQAVITATKII